MIPSDSTALVKTTLWPVPCAKTDEHRRGVHPGLVGVAGLYKKIYLLDSVLVWLENGKVKSREIMKFLAIFLLALVECMFSIFMG